MVRKQHGRVTSWILRITLAATLALGGTLIAGCATTFTGEAHFPGPQSCFQTCRKGNMTMAGYVFMGEYSSACICQAQGAHARRDVVLKGAAAAVSGSGTAVITTRGRPIPGLR